MAQIFVSISAKMAQINISIYTLKYFTDFRLETALSTEFKAENVASVLVLPAVKKRKKTRRRFLPPDMKKEP